MPTISRFAVEKGSYYRPSDNTVKTKAFLPKDGATSVFRLGDMSHAQRMAHGSLHVGRARQKAVLGYAQVASSAVTECALTLLQSEPPPLHWNIEAWPDDEDAQKALALELATRAVFVPA